MKLATQIFLGFLIAISIDLLDSFVNYALTLRVKTTSDFLNRSENVIRQSNTLEKGMVAMQSAFRGFLLTADSQYLVPFDEGLRDVPAEGEKMRGLVSLTEQTSLLDSILVIHTLWVGYAHGLIDLRKRLGAGAGMGDQFKGIGLAYNREIATLFHSFDDYEYRQRDLRRKELEKAIARTDQYSLMFSILLILVGLSIAIFLVRKISLRIGALVGLAERISRGDFGRVTDDKRDELNSLSVSLNLMSERLSRSIGALEKRNKELDQFAYAVSHDLKAPVRGVANVVRWIEEDHADEISPTIREYLAFIPARIQRMEGLIDGLLEYARAGKEGAAKEKVNLSDMVDGLADLIVPEGYVVRKEGLQEIYTERAPLQQVLGNLIGNAVKHTPPGTTTIDVVCKDRTTYYELTVSDDGPGIEPEYHEKIFGIFQTLRQKTGKESTGIGLSIVRKVVEERGGRIRVVSSPGNGASFIFTWPKDSI
jgi:signal transduction histidine kinase